MTDIRIATVDDVFTLSRLGAETFTESYGHLYNPKDLAAFLADSHSPDAYSRAFVDRKSRGWIAETRAGQAIGYATVCPSRLPIPELSANAGELKRFYILKNYQSGGLGSRMLVEILEWMERAFDRLYVSVYSENYGGIRLYERHGFQKIQEYEFMVGDHADREFIMERCILSSSLENDLA